MRIASEWWVADVPLPHDATTSGPSDPPVMPSSAKPARSSAAVFRRPFGVEVAIDGRAQRGRNVAGHRIDRLDLAAVPGGGAGVEQGDGPEAGLERLTLDDAAPLGRKVQALRRRRFGIRSGLEAVARLRSRP